MKKYKKTITISIILVVALLMFASFFGVYKKDENGQKVNILPNLKLGMEFGQTREITASINQEVRKTIYDSEGNIIEEEEGKEYTEEAGYRVIEQPVNSDLLKNLGNYKKSKEILETRLKESNVSEYFLDLDEITGTIKIEIPEDNNSEETQNILEKLGSFILLDGETYEIVLDNTYLEEAKVMYSQGDIETGVFLQLSFNEEGTNKLKELSNIYVETTEEQITEEGKVEKVTNSKVVWVFLNDAFLGTTVLPNIVYDNKVMLTFALSNDEQELQTAVEQAEKEAIILNSGTSPLLYDYTDEVKETNINQQETLIYLVSIGGVFVILYIYLIIKFKAKGFISVYFQIGFLAVLLLILRLTNAILTMEGMAGIVIAMVLEYIFTYIVLKYLKEEKEGMYKKANLEFFLNTLPVYVISIIFTFALKANINSFGITMFWGIILIYIYNFIFSKFIFENLSGRSE